MPRPRSFDEADVLAKARDAFWLNGYTATSISDLERATGLSRTSLYQAFGDKRQLYGRVLAAYREEGHARVRRMLAAAPDLRAAVRGLLSFAVASARDDQARDGVCRGCLIANATVELSTADAEVAAFVADNRARVVEMLTPLVKRDERPSTSPQQVGDFVYAVYTGIHALAKSGASPEELDDVIEGALRAL